MLWSQPFTFAVEACRSHERRPAQWWLGRPTSYTPRSRTTSRGFVKAPKIQNFQTSDPTQHNLLLPFVMHKSQAIPIVYSYPTAHPPTTILRSSGSNVRRRI